MGITKQLLKAEIDKLDDQYLEEIYKLVKSLEASRSASSDEGWHDFVDAAYGCMADAPLERPEQGAYEVRELFR